MTRALLLVSLGPVQDFIASARRCQDLWYGSWLLSELARAAATALTDSGVGGVEVIFPPGLGNDKASVANKILAEVPADAAAELADAAATAMRNRLKDLAAAALGRIVDSHKGRATFHRARAVDQLDNLMEFHWVSVPTADATYAQSRARAETLLAARKATKDWAAWRGVAGVPKSSLDGVRESVLDEALYGDRPLLPAHELRAAYRVKPTERLCGVGLLKRLGLDDADDNESSPPFHSTSHMAAAPLLVRLRDSAAIAAWQGWLEGLRAEGVDTGRFKIRAGSQAHAHLSNGLSDEGQEQRVPRVWPGPGGAGSGFDGYLLFPSRLQELLTEYAGDPAQAEVRLQRLLPRLQATLRAFGVSTPPAYFALLVADGDRMGAALDSLRSKDSHSRLSAKVAQFANECREIVEDCGGSLIYAGGDDVKALLPLHTALLCADRLQTRFAELVQPLCAPGRASPRPTLSVGLGIGHHLEPMALTLARAHRAEQLAKSRRNALAILCAKRSGGELAWLGGWDQSPVAALSTWVRWLASGALPASAAFALAEAVAPLLVPPSNWSQLTPTQQADHWARLQPVAIALVKRAWSRRRTRDGGEVVVGGSAIDAFEAHLHADPRGWPQAIANLSAQLQIARLFGEAMVAAWGGAAHDGESAEAA